jgi:molecular chaperone GrpE
LTSSRPRQSWWTRWFGVRRGEATSLRRKAQAREARRQEAREAAERLRRFVTSLITGYTMSLHRVERALHQHDLEAIATVGLPFDPETMEVLEVVYQAGRKSTEVIEEVRRGYVWRGQVFRFAQVRVARSPSS